MYIIQFAGEAFRDIHNLSKFIKIQVKHGIDKLCNNPFLGDYLERELKGLWSLHIGDCRIIYEIIEKRKGIIIYTVDFRKTVYRKKWLKKRAKKIRKNKGGK